MYTIGIDEAGRWPWAGPVVACSVAFDTDHTLSRDFLWQLKDSKKLSPKKRTDIFQQIITLTNAQNPGIYFGVWVVDAQYIDQFGIKQATKEAMRRALEEILRKIDIQKIQCVRIDGNDNFSFDELEKKPIYIVQWDTKIPEISAASIIAKVFRDELMQTYSLLYPSIGLEKHKWYGTEWHQEKICEKKYITGIHRTSYKPVKKILEKKPKLLLHVCCGPDASIPIVDLKGKYEIVCFWYDPNIQPKKEYDRRFAAFVKVCEIEWVQYIEGEYDVKNFFDEIRWLEHTPERGEKCMKCYDMRLKRSAQEAKKLGIHFWTSTLLTSPHKDLEKMFSFGEKHSLWEKLEFLKIAFRKNNGFLRSVQYCKTHDIYRQDYCGCIYSDTFDAKKFQKNTKQ